MKTCNLKKEGESKPFSFIQKDYKRKKEDECL